MLTLAPTRWSQTFFHSFSITLLYQLQPCPRVFVIAGKAAEWKLDLFKQHGHDTAAQWKDGLVVFW